MRKVFAQFALQNFLTYCIENIDSAYVRKVFAYVIFGDFFTYRCVNVVFGLCTYGFREYSIHGLLTGDYVQTRFLLMSLKFL